MAALRVVLFVEGSASGPRKRGQDPFERIWNEHLVKALEWTSFSTVVPISKKHLVAMDPANPPMSGAGEALDELMVRHLERQPFDVAVVAWDLVPAWNPDERAFCRWRETLDLYRFLAQREKLPEPWIRRADERFQELSTRTTPASRTGLPRLVPGTVLPVCMEPMFEALLTGDESAVRRALCVAGRKVDGWPRRGWGDTDERHPDQLLGKAIVALRRVRPKLEVVKKVRGDMRTNKNGWGEYLTRELLADPDSAILTRQLPRRLGELLRR